MAKRISELPAAIEVVDTDELELNQAGTSRKASRAQLTSGLAPVAHTHGIADIDATGTPDASTFLRGDGTWSAVDGGTGAVSSVFGRTGEVTAEPGDYDISEISGAGELAALDVVDADQIAGGAVRPAKIYGVSAAVPAPVDGVSTITPDDNVALYVASNAATAQVKILSPSAGRRLAISNATGHTIDLVDAADQMIRAGVPNRHVVDLNRTGGVWSFLVEYAARLHRHALSDISGAGALAAKDTVAAADIEDGGVGSSKLADTGVTPGSYSSANITVDQKGRITAASSGTSGGGLEVLDEGISLQAGVGAMNFVGSGIAAVWNSAESRIDVTVAGGAAPVDSVFGRTGAVVAQSGDYEIGEVAGAGDLAALDQVGTAQIADGAVRPAKLYGASAAVPAPVEGVSTITLDGNVALYVATDAAITQVKILSPSAGRRLAIINATGHAIDLVDEADQTIRAGVPNRYVADLNWTGSVWSFLVEYAARLHQHALAEISGTGALAGKSSVGTAEIDDAAVTGDKIAAGAVGATKLVDTPVTPGSYFNANITVDQQGRITAAGDGARGMEVLDEGFSLQSEVLAVNFAGPGVSTVWNAADTRIDVTVAGAPVESVFGRTGAVIAAAGDYSADQIDETASAKIMTGAERTKLATYPATAGALAGQDTVGTEDIEPGAVGPTELADTTVSPGAYTNANITVDQQGRVTAASDGVRGVEVMDEGVSLQSDVLAINFTGSGASAVWNAAEGRIDVAVDGGSAPVESVFGRTGAVIAAAGDYSADQIAETASAKILTDAERTKLATYPATAGALAGKDTVGTADIDNGAIANAKIASEAVTASRIGPSAVTTAKIADGAVTTAKIADGAVTTAKIDDDAVGPAQLQDADVTPGSYTHASLTVDQQGRITAASSGTPGEANTASNVGTAGVGVFEDKDGIDLRFRNVAPGSDKISVSLSGQNIDVDVVEANLEVPASVVVGLAPVATAGTLGSLGSLDANGGTITNYVIGQDSVAGSYVFVQTDSGREKIYAGASAETWTVPVLGAGTQVIVHNLGTADVTFSPDGVVLKGLTTLAPDKTACLSWLPGNVVKLTGELT